MLTQSTKTAIPYGASAILWAMAVASARAGPSYVAAVGQGPAGPVLKVAEITTLGGSPQATQAELSLAADFGVVHDLAWIPVGAGNARYLAVLGNCNDFIPAEQFMPWIGQWVGYTHHITGKIVFFDISTGPSVSRSGEAALDYTFQRPGYSLATQHNPNSLRVYHIAGLSSGGFIVQAASNEVNEYGNPSLGHYDRLIAFDAGAVQRFGADGLTGWYTGRLDVCGLVGVYPDRFINCFDTSSRAGGAGPGYLTRLRVDWAGGQLFTEANLGGDFGSDCAFMSQVAPLATAAPHVVGGGCLINEYGANSYNAPPNFSGNELLETAYGWGTSGVNNINEVMGLSSDDGVVYAMLRRNETNYELYALDNVNGSFVDRAYTFTWGGSVWTLVASDGDALAVIPAYCPLLGDVYADSLVNGKDVAGFARAQLGVQPIPGEVPACANYGTGSLAGDTTAFVADLIGG